MQSLDIIEKKMDKQTKSRKSVSRWSHDKRRRTKIIGRHHHHSQGIQIGEQIVVQVHPLSGSIRRSLEWMSYREK